MIAFDPPSVITLVGIDADTFAGAPAVLTQGRIEDLRLPDTVIVDEWGAALMGRMGVGPDGKPLPGLDPASWRVRSARFKAPASAPFAANMDAHVRLDKLMAAE